MAIPARIYPPVRLCFVPSQLATDDGLPAVAGDSTVSSRRMAAFSRSCSMVAGHSSASCQTELRVVLFRGTDADVVIELKPVWAWFLSSDEGVHLHLVLTGSVKVSRVKSMSWTPQRMELLTIPSLRQANG